ncbi:MAG: hypothetical protein LUI13_08935 [Lachnospiraceae bacterium]|nr:hypothetical protein [Lachnospiraceae bacterium]
MGMIKNEWLHIGGVNPSGMGGADRGEEWESRRTSAEAVKKGRKQNDAWKGSYTVEAAMVVSITVFVLGALMIATFYVHDRAVFQSLVCEIATAGSIQATQSENADAADAGKAQMTASRFLGSRSLSGSVTSGAEEATASWSAVYPVPGFAMRYLADGNLSIEASWSSRIVDPTDTIRLIRGAGELITGGDD